MSDANYINHYVEILTTTMTDAIIRNVSLQAQTKVLNEVVENQSKQLDEAYTTINGLKDEIRNIQKGNNSYDDMKVAYENAQNQLSHLDTFRNELIKERNDHQKTRDDYESQIATLNKKLEKLKPTPVKKVKEEVVLPAVEENTIIKDGGSF
jgi:chromosome segregation ATPase